MSLIEIEKVNFDILKKNTILLISCNKYISLRTIRTAFYFIALFKVYKKGKKENDMSL